MATIYLQYSTDTIKPPLGFGVVDTNEENTKVTASIIVPTFKNYPYFNKRYLNALNSGTISQSIYDTIINNQNEENTVEVLFNSDLEIDKSIIVGLIEDNSVNGINTEESKESIINQLKAKNLIIVKKL